MKNTTDNRFSVRQYGRTELALAYSPNLTPKGAWQKLKSWMMINPRLRRQFFDDGGGSSRMRSFTPKQVQMIVDELGEP